MQVLHTSTDFTFRLYKREFTHEMLIDYIVLSKKMDQSSLQDIFSKEELFQSTFHVSEEGLEDARMVEAIEGNELIRGRLRAVMKKLENWNVCTVARQISTGSLSMPIKCNFFSISDNLIFSFQIPNNILSDINHSTVEIYMANN